MTNDFATVDGGHGLTIGLHPAALVNPAGPTKTGISIGLYLTGALPDALGALRGRGVLFDGPVIDDGPGRFAYFQDPDGNSLYLAEMKPAYRNEAVGVL
jgi:catechol 2,3-dioxygenase-like lactoylglutathione lyase family enzyme